MKDLFSKVNNCYKCEGVLHCKDAGMSPAIMLDNINTAKVVFVAQNPGVPLKHEVGKRYEDVLMSSRIGKLFIEKFLLLSKYSYEDIYWTNICKCPTINNEAPAEYMLNNCFEYLYEQVHILSPQKLSHMVLLGSTVKKYMTYDKLNLFPSYLTAINFYHPAYIYRTGAYSLINSLCSKLE